MKLAIISDVHGNFIALKKVIEKIYSLNCHEIYFLGDSVGYLPYPNETINLLREYKIKCIKGNHELMLTGEIDVNPQQNDIYKVDITKKKFQKKTFR